MEYREAIERIDGTLRGNRSAISEICRRANQRGNSAYYNALKKNDWAELSVHQRAVIDEALNYIKDIKDGNPDPTAIKASGILN